MIKYFSSLGKLKLPDFIIAGAMKSGTTYLHYILNEHEKIFIPLEETGFFDIDDIEQHLDFFILNSDQWITLDYEKHLSEYLLWYTSFFEDSNQGQMIGEDSTTYMASEKAPSRIKELIPNVKLIFIMRDPVERAYSHYWHLVRIGRTFYNFEKTLQYRPERLLQRSFYKRQVERYKKYFLSGNMKYIIFEEFIKSPQKIIDEILDFLGLDKKIDVKSINVHKNPAKIPVNLGLYMIFNRIFKIQNNYIYHLPIKSNLLVYKNSKLFDSFVRRCLKFIERIKYLKFSNRAQNLLIKHKYPFDFYEVFKKAFDEINLTYKRKYPPMKTKTRNFLEKLFIMENRGLSEIINKDLKKYWPYMKE